MKNRQKETPVDILQKQKMTWYREEKNSLYNISMYFLNFVRTEWILHPPSKIKLGSYELRIRLHHDHDNGYHKLVGKNSFHEGL